MMNNIKRTSENPVNGHKKQWKGILSLSNSCFTLTIVFVLAGIIIISNTIYKGGESAKIAYNTAEESAAENAYDKFYHTAYVSAERDYHVSNNISIEVESAREKANLEVLRVSDVEYVIESKENNNNGIDTWIEFYGDGVYTVDMKESEFIIDSERQYVLVRVPKPELTSCRITGANPLLWHNGILDKSVSEGTNLASKMRSEGYTKLKNYMISNAQFYKGAKSSAQTIIINLVKKLNPEILDLVVDVEFME